MVVTQRSPRPAPPHGSSSVGPGGTYPAGHRAKDVEVSCGGQEEGRCHVKLNCRSALVTVSGVLLWSLTGGGSAASAAGNTPLPAHVYAPYYETYLSNTPSISSTAQASGARYFTLAFIQSDGKHSCTPTWNGNSSSPISSGQYVSDIATLRGMGGDVIPSFGGYSADQGGTEIADSCSDVKQIAAAYESVITTLGVTRLDMDVEAKSLNNTAGIDRRNKAIVLTEQWAATQGIPLQIQYTLPVEPQGLDPNGLAVLQNAATNGAAVSSVNIMVFDYYQSGEGTVNMGNAAVSAAQNLHIQLASVYPSYSSAQLWALEGMTLLPGIDDYPKKTEVTYLSDAQTMLSFAQNNGMNFLSIWAIQRDNGGCPGTRDSNVCSGITQNTWDFSNLLESFIS
jgi:Glycosyl hydrolases family 18